MKKTIIIGVSILFALSLFVGSASAKAPKTRFVTIGTGGVTGIYYPTGGAVGKIVNKKRMLATI